MVADRLAVRDNERNAGTGPVPDARMSVAAALALLLTACGYDESVELYLPLHRLELPEAPYRHFTAGQSVSDKSTRVTLTQAQSSDPPDSGRPAIQSDSAAFPLVFLEAYPFRWASVAYEHAAHDDGDHDSFRVKLHPYGPAPGATAAGSASLAITFGRGEADAEHDGRFARTSLDTVTDDIAVIGGWRVNHWLLVYGGPYYRESRYSGRYRNDLPPDGGPPVDRALSGTVRLYGANVGLNLRPIRWFDVLVEFVHGRADAGATGAENSSFNAAVRFNFGPRMGEP